MTTQLSGQPFPASIMDPFANNVDTLDVILGVHNKALIVMHFLRTFLLGAVTAML